MEEPIKTKNKTVSSRKFSVVAVLLCLVGLQGAPYVNAQPVHKGGMEHAVASEAVTQRDPFWPVGYAPKRVVEEKTNGEEAAVEKNGSTDWDKAMKQVSIQGISSRAGSESFAVINGNIKCVGESISIRVDDVNYTWLIESIAPPSSVKLRRLSAQ